ncbi:dsDNA nuclease domain-containing protein [Phaeobacter sp. JH204B]|uniref:dsDNA nuclease domain-containing protein n=1 Tax=Phaeobacter sp. JH204B TaxID=3112503 RepID=UPI003A89876E
MNKGHSPSTTLDTKDPGDDTLERYKYQCSVAAINCVRLLTASTNVVRVVCENYEDILIEHSDGSFVGLQVKTRKIDLDAFKSTDHAVIKSLSRFCALDQMFPGKFTAFDFSTNHWFWETSQNEKNLPWLIDRIKERGNVKRLPNTNPLRKFVKSICETSTFTEEQVVSTLCKTVLNCRSEPVSVIAVRVREAVGSYPATSELTFSQNAKVAEDLVNLTFQASSKKLDGEVTDLYAAGVSFDAILDAHTLAGKCIRKDQVERLLVPPKDSSEPLELSSLVPIESLPTHLAVMVQKLDKGGLQAARIEQMNDLVQSFQALLFRWINKHGVKQAEARYQTLLATVKFECTEAQIASEAPDTQYAPRMYELLFERLRARVAEEHVDLHGCRPEHLMGAAGMLTEQCKTWWSPKFKIEKA